MLSLQERLNTIQAELHKVLREVDKIKAQEALILDMIREAKGEPKSKLRAPRSNVKQTVLEILEEAGVAGVNAAFVVEHAARNGISLERGTVSSLLSRFKSDGTVTYDGSVYRLATNYQGDKVKTVHPIRTSGSTQDVFG